MVNGLVNTLGEELTSNATYGTAETNGAQNRTLSAAEQWISELPPDARFHREPKQHKRSLSDGTRHFMLFKSETSPRTSILVPSTTYTSCMSAPSPKRSPRRSSTGQFFSSMKISEENSGTTLPPLMLPGSLQFQSPSNMSSTVIERQVSPKRLHQASHDYDGLHWAVAKVPEILQPDDASAFSHDTHNTEPLYPNARHWIEGRAGRRAWAEYQMFNEALELHPQIMLHIESPDSFRSPSNNSDSTMSTPHASTNLANSQHSSSFHDIDLGPAAQELPVISSPGVKNDERAMPTPPGYHRHKVVVPLHSDERFFNALIQSVRNLLKLHISQQRTLIQHVNTLCEMIAQVASPNHTPKDMYQWREIFTLWIEHDIFESSREKDRGELSVAATEERLHKYMEQLEVRGFLAPHEPHFVAGSRLANRLDSWAVQAFEARNPLQDPRSVGALEYFLRLNVALVSLKRFQRLNLETVRKILKKHEKKTALHVQQPISQIVLSPQAHQLILAASLDSPIPECDWEHASSGDILKSLAALAPMSTSTATQLSLPRILASLMTKSLLPILPQVDDYSCLVCTSIAWHPIRLSCHHLFCIRCIVKLQKQGSDHCPVCRHPNAVKDADENCYDQDMADYLRKWFPEEVAEKTKDNRQDLALHEHKEKIMRRKRRLAKLRRFGRSRPEDGDTTDCVIC